MSAMMFYENIVPLNDKLHVQLHLRPLRSYAFAAKANSVPALAGEFAECARQYPLVFAGSDGGIVPAVLLGLREGENLFVDASGQWSGRYIPAFVRRYPFALGTGDAGQMVVCIDDAASCLSLSDGDPLFAGGVPSAALQKAMGFLREFQSAALATAAMAARIEALGLLREADSLAQLNNGEQFRLSGMRVVDEQRLSALDDATLVELSRSGAMKLIYAHMISLGNLAPLMDRLNARMPAKKKATTKSRAAATT